MPTRNLSVSDMSPMSFRSGRGSFLMSVGVAIICSPLASCGLLVDVYHLEFVAAYQVFFTEFLDIGDCLG